MRMHRRAAIAMVAALLLAWGTNGVHAAIVYLGQDPSFHWQAGEPQAAILGGNAARYAAGGAANPTILAVSDGSFGENLPGMLANQGLTLVTSITPAALASTNLSLY